MKPKKIWANYGVSDLERTTKFYTTLGFKPNGKSTELTSFTVGEKDFIIHFFLKEHLKAGIKGELADLEHGNEIVLLLLKLFFNAMKYYSCAETN
jgi:predicted lactoylglutathione lyase